MTHAVDYPEPVLPHVADPAALPVIACGMTEDHQPHIWIGAWADGDQDPRRCPGAAGGSPK